jgi:hypothetical protein
MLARIFYAICILIGLAAMAFVAWMCVVMTFGSEPDYPYPHEGLHRQEDLDAVR